MNKCLNKFAISAFILILFSCHQKQDIQPSFYYWKTTFSLSLSEKECLKNNAIKHLYVRFFDVDVDEQTHELKPLGIIDSLENIPENCDVIPVVFITNRSFIERNAAQVKELAGLMVTKINNMYTNYKELQIDCDWSQKTKENYFIFLGEVKKQIKSNTKLTCTIRLHQVKYPDITGLPPVDGGMLMFYNMGNIHDVNEQNSIYNEQTAEKYVAYSANYPLHLDVALPLFNWLIHYRNNDVVGLITKKQLPDVTNEMYFYHEKNTQLYIVRVSQLINGIYYKEGDVLKKEILSNKELIKATQQVYNSLKPENRRVVLYDLDEQHIKNYEKETLKTVFTTFNN